ncbi:MAG: hypothetical protein IT168_20690 [Bryobacterales bacterium]|nr:hypothetical protein [Bryobacterales bacterium]
MAVKEEKSLIPVPLVIALVVSAVLAGAGYYVFTHQGGGSATELTPEAKAYTRNLKLGEVEMKAHASYLGQEVVEITGKIGNAGDRELRQVDLNCVFYDPYGQVVLRERVSIVRQKTGGLKPAETRTFRLPFDTIPASWNKQMPQLVIAGIVF